MITSIETKNCRCLRYIKQPLGPFHVLVGANASGKTTFLDVIAFLGRLVSDGLEKAVVERTKNFSDLLWDKTDHQFELVIEANILKPQRESLCEDTKKEFAIIRYEVAIGTDPTTMEISILTEKVLLKPHYQLLKHHPKAL
jgi:AAA15 family ATPase/GTPase